MPMSRRKRLEFRPNLGDGPLEERVVPATITPVVRTQESLLRNFFLNSMENRLSGRQLRVTLRRELRTITNDARTAIRAQARQLFADGRPTAQQRADFNATAGGVLNATALRLSSLVSLLPGGTGLVPGIQRSLIGGGGNSLASRIEGLTQSGRATRSLRSLDTSIGREISRVVGQGSALTNQLVRGNALNTVATDAATGQVIPLRQFVGNQLITQFGNTLGGLSQSFSTVANSALFADGATEATAEAQQAFAQQYSSALGLAAFQLGSGLSLLSGFNSGLTTQLQTGLFDTSDGSTSLFSSLQGLPNASDGFSTAASTAFGDAFSGLTSPLSSFFSLPSSQTFSLPTSNIPGLFGGEFSSVGNGFNNGFGSGFPGFGTASSDFNTNFGTGFNNAVSSANTAFGFRITPILDGTGTATGTGTGTGTTVPGTGTGTPTTGTGTGTPTTGTGTGTGLPGGSGTGLGT